MNRNEVKENLARLLATEDLVIEHRDVSTASFDVVNRVLTLPSWNLASNVVYDLLVGHEVGHALFTPEADLKECMGTFPSVINVVEDVRIEKLMRRKYPGLKKTFYNGYKELADQDFFCIEDSDVNMMSLADKINLNSKIGPFIDIRFSKREMDIVNTVLDVETFEDVIHASTILHNYCTEEIKKEETSQKDPKDLEEKLDSSSIGSDSSNNISSNDVCSDTDTADITSSEGSNSTGDANPGVVSHTPSESIVETQESFDEALETLSSDRYYRENVYLEIPSVNLDTIIIDNIEFSDHVENNFKEQTHRVGTNNFVKVDEDFNQFKKSAQREVNYLIKEFECRKSADSYKRSLHSKTGVLDMNSIHTYKWNEDIFKKITVVPDGKSHGLIFLLDWSGSMHEVLHDTCKQLFNLVWFCKKVGLPFDVYAFTNEWNGKVQGPDHYEPKNHVVHIPNNFSLMNILTSKCKGKELDNQIKNLYRISYAYNNRYNCTYCVPDRVNLSGTPLNESLISLNKIIPQFKKRYSLQKVHCIILTDGEATSVKRRVNVQRNWEDELYLGFASIRTGSCYLRDRMTGYVYSFVNSPYQTKPFLRQLKNRFPFTNFVGIRLINSTRDFTSFMDMLFVKDKEEIRENWKKNRSVSIRNNLYDSYIAISSKVLNNDTSFEVREDATKVQIGSAFRKSLKSKKMNKRVLDEFIEMVV